MLIKIGLPLGVRQAFEIAASISAASLGNGIHTKRKLSASMKNWAVMQFVSPQAANGLNVPSLIERGKEGV